MEDVAACSSMLHGRRWRGSRSPSRRSANLPLLFTDDVLAIGVQLLPGDEPRGVAHEAVNVNKRTDSIIAKSTSSQMSLIVFVTLMKLG